MHLPLGEVLKKIIWLKKENKDIHKEYAMDMLKNVYNLENYIARKLEGTLKII